MAGSTSTMAGITSAIAGSTSAMAGLGLGGPQRFAGSTYSTDPVYQTKAKSGFCHNFYIMYHATDPAVVEKILSDGFNLSTGPKQMLGDGVYCSLALHKAFPRYGKAAFRLLVYTGKTHKCTVVNDPKRKTWQADYASCWVPPGSLTMNASGLEENCIRSRNQIRILGIAKGWDLLSPKVQAMSTNAEGKTANALSDREKIVLTRLRCEVGECWTMLEAKGSHGLVMDVSKKTNNVMLWQKPKKDNKGHRENKDNQLFKVWHDKTIRCKLDPEKILSVRSDGKTLFLSKEPKSSKSTFHVKVYEGNIIRNNIGAAGATAITASNLTKGGEVTVSATSPTTWWFIK